MWNSSDPSDKDLSKKVDDMSAALNLSSECLQQFMSGSLSVERLATMRPTVNKDESCKFL